MFKSFTADDYLLYMKFLNVSVNET